MKFLTSVQYCEPVGSELEESTGKGLLKKDKAISLGASQIPFIPV